MQISANPITTNLTALPRVFLASGLRREESHMLNPKSASAWVRQPSTLFFLAIVVGTAVATWFNVIPPAASVALLAACVPLLVNDTTSDTAANPALVAVVNALATHHDVGPAAMQVIRTTAPHLLTDGTLALTARSTSSTPRSSSGLTAVACLVGCGMLLTACGSTTQAKLRQSVYDIDSAYHVMAEPMPDVMAGKMPGITLTDAEKALVKSASQSVFNEITSLETSIEGGKSVSSTAVSALETDFASFESCWTGMKAGQQPSACAGIATTTTGN